MEEKSEEGPNSVEHITIKYELEESPVEEVGFYSSDVSNAVVETHELLAVENSEDRLETTTNSYALASVTSILNNVENSKVQLTSLDETSCVEKEPLETVLEQRSAESFGGSDWSAQDITAAKKSTDEDIIENSEDRLETTTNKDALASVTSILNNVENSNVRLRSVDETVNCVLGIDDRFVEKEPFETVLEQRSSGSLGGSDWPVQDITVAKKSTDEDIIEIDDSSEEETQNPVVSSECTPEEAKEQSELFTGGEPTPADQNIVIRPELSFKAFEDAMDDWYTKLSVHGPLKDCEIMDSARQLALHFNFGFPDDAKWLIDFKNRQLLKKVNGNKRWTKTKAVKRRGQHGERGGSIESSRGKINKPANYEQESAKIAKKQLAAISSNAYSRLPKEVITESPDYPLLLSRAQNADPSGRTGDGALHVTERRRKVRNPKGISERLHSIPVVNLDDESTDESVTTGATNEEPSSEAMSRLEARVAEWYFSLTSRHKTMVAPCIFEAKAVEIAQSMKMVNFHPSKTWIEKFIRQYGLWCTLSHDRLLFLEPEDGLLKYRFEVEFEAWYHVFPDSPENIIAYYLAGKKLDFRLKMKKYLAAVFNWYSSKSSVSGNDILIVEARYALLNGLSDADVQSVRELYRDWCVRHKHFSESVREAYNVGLPILLPQTLRNVSLRWAFACSFNGFTPSQFWMRRYLQLNGLFYKEDEVVKWYRLDSTSCGHENFDHIFRIWEVATVRSTERLKHMLELKFRENAGPPSHRIANFPEEPETPLKIGQTFTLYTGST